MKFRFFLFISIMYWSHLGVANTAPAMAVRETIIETCSYYQGQPLAELIMPGVAGQLNNPLSASPLGRRLLSKNLKSGFNGFNYFNPDEEITAIIGAADFQPALDFCYQRNEIAKMNFTFLLRKIEVDGKSLGGYVQALAFYGGARSAGWVFSRSALIRSIVKWTGFATTAISTLYAGKVSAEYISFLRGKRQKAKLELKDSAVTELDKEQEASSIAAKENLAALEKMLMAVRANLSKEQDPVQIKRLQSFEKETLQILLDLQQQLQTK